MVFRTIMYAVHIISEIMTLILYFFYLRSNVFDDIAGKVLLIFFGSAALIFLLFRRTQKGGIKIYFLVVTLLVLSYTGLWLILGLRSEERRVGTECRYG